MFRVRVQNLWRVPVVGSKLSTKQKRQKRGTFANGICEVKRALPLSILILLKPALSTELTEVLFRNRVWNTRSKVGGAERQWKLAQLVCLWSHCCFCVGECKLGQFDQATETSDEQTGTLSLISAAFHLSRCLFGPQWIVFYLISRGAHALGKHRRTQINALLSLRHFCAAESHADWRRCCSIMKRAHTRDSFLVLL